LTATLRASWKKISTRTALQLTDLDKAESAAGRLLEAIREDGQGPSALNSLLELRQRYFTLLVRAYDQVRRAVTFLHWGAEADRLAPSLYGRRVRRAKRGAAPVPSL
jgi:hypothetical protein